MEHKDKSWSLEYKQHFLYICSIRIIIIARVIIHFIQREMSQNRDVLELWRRLRQESLFVSNEREGLTRLHQELKGWPRVLNIFHEN